jgi:hypothetical protein
MTSCQCCLQSLSNEDLSLEEKIMLGWKNSKFHSGDALSWIITNLLQLRTEIMMKKEALAA